MGLDSPSYFCMQMMYSSIPVARQILSACLQNKIKHVIISPGSRSAPLTLSFGSHPAIKCYSIVDERSAAFFGLGLALQTKETVALICTSGTALLNFYPAVCEAFYSQVPLLVLSADRPTYFIDRGDGQTIRQDQVLASHCVYSISLHQDVSHATDKIKRFAPVLLEKSQEEIKGLNQLFINRAFGTLKKTKGPVHINIPFEEPLYQKTEIEEEALLNEFMRVPDEQDKKHSFSDVTKSWSEVGTKLVLVGQINQEPQNQPHWLSQLIQDPTVVVLTETTSNLNHPDCVDSIDSVIAPVEKMVRSREIFEKMKPEILITIGGMVVSKKIKKFLRDYSPKEHWHVGPNKALDTYFCLSQHFQEEPGIVFPSLVKNSRSPKEISAFKTLWLKLKSNYERGRENYLKEIPYSDFKIYDLIFKTLPEGIDLHLSNSSTIRYAQLFAHKYSWRTFCNRGTSGIDGSTSTALGSASASHLGTILITGDLSFFYDSNAFWNTYVNKGFKVVLINNDGGGIFRILPGQEESEVFENYFETPHGRNAKLHCEQYQWEYQCAENGDELKRKLSHFFKERGRNSLLEIKTPRKLNDKVLLEYFEFLNLELNFL